MPFLKTIFMALLIGFMPTMAIAASSLSEDQKAEVEAIVRELLTKKEPEIIIKAAEVVQGKMDRAVEKKGKDALVKNKDKLLGDPSTPVGGNPKGDVTIVEFFDYGCGYCKMAQKHVETLLAEDKNVRLLYKEFAILGPNSLKASEAALASNEQGKYVAFHNALMESKSRPGPGVIMDIAQDVGLDMDKLKKDMESEKIKNALKINRELGGELGIRGTPSFVIDGKLYPGAMSLDQLREAVAAARKSKQASRTSP